MACYHELTSGRFSVEVGRQADWVVIEPVPHLEYLAEYRDIVEDCLLGMSRMIEQLTAGLVPASDMVVHFSYPEPEYAEVYYEVFHCPCSFDRENSSLMIPARWLDLPVSSANPVVSELCAGMCARIFGDQSRSLEPDEAIRRLLIHRPAAHMLRLDEAAQEMKLSQNQLRKRLYRAGTSYKQIVLEVRMLLAKHYLQQTGLSLQEIAYLLDYSQPAPFSRAYKRYYGVTPRYHREIMAGGFNPKPGQVSQ